MNDSTLFPLLRKQDRLQISRLEKNYRLTFQERRQISEWARDLEMWEEKPIGHWIQQAERKIPQDQDTRRLKKTLLSVLKQTRERLMNEPPKYGLRRASAARKNSVLIRTETAQKIFGLCPVASPKTVCCQLKTIDAVKGCAFDCSYCTIQEFYGKGPAKLDSNLGAKLEQIELDPKKLYHFGTGQSSDSLVWGNRFGLLDDLCQFAEKHPNVILELKTKSALVEYFLDHEIPANIVLSWSLNPEKVIRAEEKRTAPLTARLRAAEKAAQRGIPVAFHFHPIVRYQTWEKDYSSLAAEILKRFSPDQVLFISMGSVTFIKPVLQSIRRRGNSTQIARMPMVSDPHGKWTYPDEIKESLFKTVHGAFKPWHGKVYMYLCMERAYFWDRLWGWHYPDNDRFEADFCSQCRTKMQAIRTDFYLKKDPS